MSAWASPVPRLSAAHVDEARRLFTTGAYTRLDEVLPLLLAAAEHSAEHGAAGAARASGLWVLASQHAAKQGRTEPAGAYAKQAGAAARRSGDPVVLAAAARAASTPLRHSGRTDEALLLLRDAHLHLTAAGPAVAELEAAGLAALTAAYTAAQAHRPALARDFADHAEQITRRLARHPHPSGCPWELTAGQCALYRIGIHRCLGDYDTALAHARQLRSAHLPTAERRARAATDTARALFDAGDVTGAFTQLRLVELAAPLEARRPSVRALTVRIAGLRPGLPGLSDFVRRTAASSAHRTRRGPRPAAAGEVT